MNRMPAAVEMNVAEGPEAEGARRATGASGPSATLRAPTPDPEVPAKVQRRQFTAAYRLRILKEADACTKHGALGALLRREGLYSSHLVNWRRQREQGELCLHGREEALDHGIVVAVAAPAHTAGDPARREDGLVVLGRVGAASIGVVQQTGLRTPSLEGHIQGLDRETPIIHGAHGPADEES